MGVVPPKNDRSLQTKERWGDRSNIIGRRGSPFLVVRSPIKCFGEKKKRDLSLICGDGGSMDIK